MLKNEDHLYLKIHSNIICHSQKVGEKQNKTYIHTVGYYLIKKRNEALIDTSQPQHG